MNTTASPADLIFAFNVLCVLLWVCVPRLRRQHNECFRPDQKEE